MLLSLDTIAVGARSSALSQAQVKEVLEELHHSIEFNVQFLQTTGDRDLHTSLRTLGTTDFFTKELDALVLSGGCQIAIHSAKDLPYPLPEGLQIVALTRGLPSTDSLVLREGETLRSNALIATSSERREEAVRAIKQDVRFCDIRGTIEQRLAKLYSGEVDGVVIAEAALIRLGLTHLNRITLPGTTVPLQGKLAIVARSGDDAMKQLFASIDTRTRSLYVGLELPPQPHDTLYTHYPVITTVPLDPYAPSIVACFRDIPRYTHVIFTSKTAVRTFSLLLAHHPHTVDHLTAIAVGKKTAAEVRGFSKVLVAEEETAEGITPLLTHGYFFWPHSTLSRPVISTYLKEKHLPFKECAIYDTLPFRPGPPPSLESFDSIVFTSPSTVRAFIQIFGKLPHDKQLKSIGPITQETIALLTCDKY